jgi:hypothetical protein
MPTALVSILILVRIATPIFAACIFAESSILDGTDDMLDTEALSAKDTRYSLKIEVSLMIPSKKRYFSSYEYVT